MFIRFILIVLLSGTFSVHNYAGVVSPADRQILATFQQYALRHQIENLPVEQRIPLIARFFIGKPYKSNTLNVTKEDLPVINLRELDCVTFVENVLALACLEHYTNDITEDFVHNIVKLRYRNGEIVDYTSRFHYSTDWLYEMGQQHLLADKTLDAGGILYPQHINFMSGHISRYPMLERDPKLVTKIKSIETAISQRTYYHIPKEKILEAEKHIQEGDVILITTNIKGLDTSHLGFAARKEGRIYLLHASSLGKKVMFSQVPLQEYMQDIKHQTGIMIARICPPKQ